MISAMDSLPIFFAVFWKSGVALGAALAINRLFRNKSADVRRLVLSTAVIAMFVAAAAVPVLPRWTAVIPLWFQAQRPPAQAVTERASTPEIIDDSEDTTDTQLPAAKPTAHLIDLRPWVLPLIWIVGAATLLARFAINLYGLRRLRMASDAMIDAALPRGVQLCGSETIGAPVTWGIVRPIILVPAGFEELPAECRDAVLHHELAHIRAHDFMMRVLAEIARALIWFQPLMWIVWRQLREEQELACDNRVLAAGGKPSAYARLLMDWDVTPGLDSLIAVGIANRSCLKRRLYALLNPDLRRDRVAKAGIAGACLLGMAAALPLAAISFAQAKPPQPALAYVAQPDPPARAPLVPNPPVQVAQAQARTVPAHAPAFEVASIKPWQQRLEIGGIHVYPGGRIEFRGCTVHYLIESAFNLQDFQVSGGAAWIQNDRYDIDAKPPASSKSSQYMPPYQKAPMLEEQRQMLQSLLAERFQFKYHRETREGPVYLLVKGNKPLKMTDSKDKGEFPWAGFRGGPRFPAGIVGINESMEDLASRLAVPLGRLVLDRTGITGSFDFRAEYAPDDLRPDIVGIILTSVQDLGLKLEPSRGPVETIMIDHIEKPSAN